MDRRLTRAQARLTQAVTAPAKIRRLNAPAMIGQINVGGKINGAVRVTAGDARPAAYGAACRRRSTIGRRPSSWG